MVSEGFSNLNDSILWEAVVAEGMERSGSARAPGALCRASRNSTSGVWSPLVTAGGCGDSANTASQLCQGHQLLVPGCSFLLLPWSPPQALAASLLLPTRLQQPDAPSGSCSQLRTSTSLPRLLHASLFSPFLTQVPFRYLYSVILFPCSAGFLGHTNEIPSVSAVTHPPQPCLPPAAASSFFLFPSPCLMSLSL